MESCLKCLKSYQDLPQHQKKNPNCINRCTICLKRFSSGRNLTRHNFVICVQKYECKDCSHIYKSVFRLKNHKCSPVVVLLGEDLEYLEKIIPNINNKQVNIIHINSHNNNNNKDQTHSITQIKNVVKTTKNNFFDTKPKAFRYDYNTDNIDLHHLQSLHNYTETMADKYMYEETDFRERHKDFIYQYDKEKLETEGLKILFTKLQMDPKNRSVMIQKAKSGKCYVYETEWVQKELQKIITKICGKLCNTIYDKETSLNYFFHLVIGSQPGRYMELRKHIEEEILQNKGRLLEN